MDPEIGMDRARPFRFCEQLPRTTIEEVTHQERVYDKQVLLNESWVRYCDRAGHPDWRSQEPDRDKWVTETWDEHEVRRRKQPAAIEAFNQKVDEKNEQIDGRSRRRQSRARQVLDDIRRREEGRGAQMLPVLHTLLVDFDEKREMEQAAERATLEEAEEQERNRLQEELRAADYELLRLERESLDRVRDLLELKEAQERQRQKELEEARLREEREREEAKQREEELERERVREAEESKKRKEQEEKDRKARERREKLRAEREKRKSLEEEAAQRRDSRRRSSAQLRGAGGSARDLRRGSLAMQQDMRRDEAREKRLQRQSADLAAYLDKLRGRVAEVDDEDKVQKLLREVAEELGGQVLFDCAVYIATLGDGKLHFKYASQNCSPVLRAGHETVSMDEHPECPTVKEAVNGKATALHPSVLADPPDGCPTIVRVGTKEGKGPGDFFTTPIFNSAGDVAAVLSADTLNELNGKQAASTLQPDEEDCYLGEPPIPAVKITDETRDFLVAVAKLLSEALVKGYTPTMDASTVGGLYAQLTKSVSQLLGQGSNCYISVMPRVAGTSLTVVAQNGITEPGSEPIGGHANVVGKTLGDGVGPSFSLEAEEDKYSFFGDVRKDDGVRAYAGGEKRGDFLLLIPILAQHKGGLGVAGVVGVEGPADRGISDDQIRQVIAVMRQLNARRPKLLAHKLCRQLALQCVQWVHALSGCTNVYLSAKEKLLHTPEDGEESTSNRLRYIAATPPQKWVVGKVLEEGEGVTWSVIGAEGGPVRHIPDISKQQQVKLLGQIDGEPEGQLVVAPIVGRGGEPLGAIYMDTVNWQEGKKNLTKADIEMIGTAGTILGLLLSDISEGKNVGEQEEGEMELQIEREFSAGPVRFLKKVWLHVLNQLLGMKREELLEIAKYNKPADAIPPVCAASFIITGTKPKAVAEWDQCRKRFKHQRLQKMTTFDPTKTKPAKPFFIRAKKMIKGCTVDFVAKAGSKPVSLIFYWTYVNIQLRYAAMRLRKLFEQGQLELFDDSEIAVDDAATEASTEFGSSVGDEGTEVDPCDEAGEEEPEEGGDDE